MFSKLFFLPLFFIGIFIGTFAYNDPDDLLVITNTTFKSYRVFENPFFIYIDVKTLAEKQCDAGAEECLCYFGPNAPSIDILKHHLSEKEKDLMGRPNFKIETTLDKSVPASCGSIMSLKTNETYGYMDPRKDSKKEPKWNLLHQLYGGEKIDVQKICVSAKALDLNINTPNYETIKWYEVTIKTTGNGQSRDAHFAKLKTLPTSGFLQLQFNTKMGVLQPFGDISSPDNQFIVVPQIAPIKGFDYSETSGQMLEDTFVEILYEQCSKKGGNGVFHYSKSDLKNTDFATRPPSVASYIGTLLLPNGPSVSNMYEKNLTDVEDILYNEMLYHLKKPV